MMKQVDSNSPGKAPTFALTHFLPLAGEPDEDRRWDSEAFWGRLRAELRAGNFWADEIKKLRSEPEKRLQLAVANLPLPAAFREAGIALRALIAERRKNGSDDIAPLVEKMYVLAALESFFSQDGFIQEAQRPEFNVIEFLTGQDYAKLKIEYDKLGYRKLPLGARAQKLVAEVWGEPSSHATLRELYPEVWVEGVARLVQSVRAGRE